MPDEIIKISELPSSSALDGSEIVPIVKDGVTSQTTTQEIADLGTGGGSSAYELEITGDNNPANDTRTVTHGLNNSKPTIALWYEYESGKWRQLDITQGITTETATPNVLTINLLAYEGNTPSNKYSITVR